MSRWVAVVAGSVAAVSLVACSSAAPTPSTPAPISSAPRTAVSVPTPSAHPTPPAKELALPKPVNHCAHNSAAQLVLVKLSVQRMWLCARHHTVRSNPITSGMLGAYTHTPTGHFHIQGLNRNSVLTLNTGATYDVKYWIPFDAPLFGFHDASWQNFPYGSPSYKTAGSHGCVHMPLQAIAFLYHWARIGADVAIS